MNIKRIWIKLNNYFKELPGDNSLELLNRLVKYKNFLEEKIEVENQIIELQKEENEIQASLLEENKVYVPKNQQGREGKKYKGNLINLAAKDNTDSYPYV